MGSTRSPAHASGAGPCDSAPAPEGACIEGGAGGRDGADPCLAPSRTEIREQILLRDAPRNTAALHGRDLEAVLRGDLANERGGASANALFEGVTVPRGGGNGRGGSGVMGGGGGKRTILALGGGPPSRCRRRNRRRSRRRARRRTLPRRVRRLVRLQPRDHRLHRNGLSLHHQNLGENTCGRRGDLRVHLVRGNLEDRLVALYLIPDRLEPARERTLGNRLAHLRHDYIHPSHESPSL